MYCPKCGYRQLYEEAHFCSRCGLKLHTSKVLSAEASAAGEQDAYAVDASPRQRNINIGMTLMLLSTLLTFGIIMGALQIGLAGGFLILTASLLSILAFSGPITGAIYKLICLDEPSTDNFRPQRKEMSFGAMLMFVGAILSACVASLMPPRLGDTAFLLTLMPIFILLLFSSRRLMWTVQDLLTEKQEQPNKALISHIAPGLITGIGSAPDNLVMQPAQGLPIAVFHNRPIKTGEIVSPSSVTERTTSLLENK